MYVLVAASSRRAGDPEGIEWRVLCTVLLNTLRHDDDDIGKLCKFNRTYSQDSIQIPIRSADVVATEEPDGH